MLKIFSLLLAITTFSIFLIFSQSTKAQTTFNDDFGISNKIEISKGIPFLRQGFKNNFQSIWNTVSGIFKDINKWLKDRIGINIFEIIKTIGNFVIWILELIIKIIKAILSLIY